MKSLITFFTLNLIVSAIQAGIVTPSLQKRLDHGGSLDISIYLPSNSDILTSKSLLALERDERIEQMISSLKHRTLITQQPFINLLTQHGKTSSEIKSFWATNFLRVKNATKSLVSALSQLSGDFTIREPIIISLIHPVESRDSTPEEIKQEGSQWGVSKVEAERAWNYTRGEDAVVAVIDTGVHMTHTALRDNFGGAWFDPYYDTPQPTDVQGHGTHTTGTAVGTANGIGVAPEAQWIACRGLDHQGYGTEEALIACGEWIVTAVPRPHVCSNSWGGGSNDDWYNDVISLWRAADIVPVFAIGNSGSWCNSVLSPGDQPGLISVAATDPDDAMAYFSSRGPGPNNLQKPEVSAPGVGIVSAGNRGTNQYTTMSGTSMATPHFAGAVALYMSLNPNATYTEVYDVFTSTSDRPVLEDSDKACGNAADPEDFPNMAFGYGRINAGNAMESE